MGAAPLALPTALAPVPDPRSRFGRYSPLTALLRRIAVALLAGQRSPEAIAPLGRDHGTPLAHALGLRSDRPPCKATLANLRRRLDGAAFAPALLRWLHARCPDRGDRLALDGKTRRGTADYEVPGPPYGPLTPPRSRASWANGGSGARPTSTKPPWDCWASYRGGGR